MDQILKSRGCQTWVEKTGPNHTLSTKEILKDDERLKVKRWENDTPCKQ